MVNNSKNGPGRPIRLITGSFLDSEPSLVQAVIISKKNKDGGRSWQAVADDINEEAGTNFSGALMYRIAKGLTNSKRVEQALGLIPKTERVEVCPTHGTVHCYDCQTQTVIEKPAEPKPPSNRKRTYPDYAKMRTNDIAQANRQVEKHYPGYEITKKEK